MEKNVYISFYLRRYTIHIHRSTLMGIGDPPFIKLLINQEKKSFVVLPSVESDFRSTRVHAGRSRKSMKADLYSIGLCNSLAQLNGWNKNKSYRVNGHILSAQNAAVFSFSNSVDISDIC